MTNAEINFTNMCDAVIAGFDAKNDLWESKSPIVNAVQHIKAFRAELEGLAFDQANLDTKSTTKTLKVHFYNLVELNLQVVQRLRPYALAKDDQGLLVKIDFAKTDFTHGSQKEALVKSKIVLEEGRKHIDSLTGYELTPEMLDAQEAAINGVALLSGNRDAIIGNRKTATEGIPLAIKRIRKQLDILDDLVPVLIDDETFIQNYQNNRRIIDR